MAMTAEIMPVQVPSGAAAHGVGTSMAIDTSRLAVPEGRERQSQTEDHPFARNGAHTTEEVRQVALDLGLDPVYDAQHMYLCDEILNAKCPRGWVEFRDADGLPYYYNEATKATQWEHPLLDFYRAVVFMLKGGAEKLKQAAFKTPPTPLEARDMAQYLGIDPVKEPDLVDIAKAAVNAPLPPQWQQFEDNNSNVKYYNSITGVEVSHHPLDGYFLELIRQRRAERAAAPAKSTAVEPTIANYHKLVPEGRPPLPWVEFLDGQSRRVFYFSFQDDTITFVHPTLVVKRTIREAAAVRLQAWWRGHMVRQRPDLKSRLPWLEDAERARRLEQARKAQAARSQVAAVRQKRTEEAALSIQCAFRGFRDRKMVAEMRHERALAIIQRWWRGALARRQAAKMQQQTRGAIIPRLPPPKPLPSLPGLSGASATSLLETIQTTVLRNIAAYVVPPASTDSPSADLPAVPATAAELRASLPPAKPPRACVAMETPALASIYAPHEPTPESSYSVPVAEARRAGATTAPPGEEAAEAAPAPEALGDDQGEGLSAEPSAVSAASGEATEGKSRLSRAGSTKAKKLKSKKNRRQSAPASRAARTPIKTFSERGGLGAGGEGDGAGESSALDTEGSWESGIGEVDEMPTVVEGVAEGESPEKRKKKKKLKKSASKLKKSASKAGLASAKKRRSSAAGPAAASTPVLAAAKEDSAQDVGGQAPPEAPAASARASQASAAEGEGAAPRVEAVPEAAREQAGSAAEAKRASAAESAGPPAPDAEQLQTLPDSAEATPVKPEPSREDSQAGTPLFVKTASRTGQSRMLEETPPPQPAAAATRDDDSDGEDPGELQVLHDAEDSPAVDDAVLGGPDSATQTPKGGAADRARMMSLAPEDSGAFLSGSESEGEDGPLGAVGGLDLDAADLNDVLDGEQSQGKLVIDDIGVPDDAELEMDESDDADADADKDKTRAKKGKGKKAGAKGKTKAGAGSAKKTKSAAPTPAKKASTIASTPAKKPPSATPAKKGKAGSAAPTPAKKSAKKGKKAKVVPV
ncbi:unnamed protein product [Pedinophyceae sp. YPF-701]|nr:unnamed protein product [Pedinophyceae sp. YPF-701]